MRFRIGRKGSLSHITAAAILLLAPAGAARADDVIRVGPGGHTVTIGAAAGGEATVSVASPSGTPLGTFSVPAGRQVIPGASGLALVPAADHAVGVAYAIDFLDFAGAAIATDRRDDLSLHFAQAEREGTWIVHGLAKSDARHTVLRYDAGGRFQWRRSLDGVGAPLVRSVPAGGPTVIGTAAANGGSHFVLVGPDGSVLRNEVVNEFRTIAFDVSGDRVALAGGGSVQLRSTGDGALLGMDRLPAAVALGGSIAFGTAPGELFVVTQDAAAAGGAVRMHRFVITAGAAERYERELTGIPASAPARILTVTPLAGGGAEVVTDDRSVRVDFREEDGR